MSPNKEDLIRWDVNGVPHSTLFQDKYFCTQNGYEECRYIALEGHDLSRRLQALDPKEAGVFTIMETGFGTGLSFCCLWQLWDELAPSSWKLHFISIDLYPLSQEDLNKALSIWPLLNLYRERLNAVYIPAASGLKQWDLDGGRIKLSLAFEEVVASLQMIKDKKLAAKGADAWLLNGFSPFANPMMWRPEVFKGMAQLSYPGTSLATFTVAAAVRRGLEAEGFKVEKFKGFGRKKEALRGYFKNGDSH